MRTLAGRPLWLTWAIAFAAVGFVVGEALCVSTFYLTSHELVGNEVLFFLALCPPSIASLGLDNAGPVRAVIWWKFLAAANAALYGAVAYVCGLVYEQATRGSK
jgi:hypothetical protein